MLLKTEALGYICPGYLFMFIAKTHTLWNAESALLRKGAAHDVFSKNIIINGGF